MFFSAAYDLVISKPTQYIDFALTPFNAVEGTFVDNGNGVPALGVVVQLNGLNISKGVSNSNGKFVCFSPVSQERQDFVFIGENRDYLRKQAVITKQPNMNRAFGTVFMKLHTIINFNIRDDIYKAQNLMMTANANGTNFYLSSNEQGFAIITDNQGLQVNKNVTLTINNSVTFKDQVIVFNVTNTN